MGTIKFYPCMIFDAICYFEQRHLENKQRMRDDQITFIEKLNTILHEKVDDNELGMSSLCLVISTYTNNENLEKLTLEDLIEILKDPQDIEKVVRERTSNEFTASYLFRLLEYLKAGWADNYIKKLKVLQQSGFEEDWKLEAYPHVMEQIAQKDTIMKTVDTKKLFLNIEKLKKCKVLDDVKIFVSYLSYPTAFTLYNGCFLDCFGANERMPFMVAHELMHGFASGKLIELYLQYVNGDKYLMESHRKLIEEMHSGDEEEFVMAAEYYLGYLLGLESKENLIDMAKTRYRGCLPVSVMIFDRLTKEKEVPYDYNDWLIQKFESGAFLQENIEDFISKL